MDETKAFDALESWAFKAGLDSTVRDLMTELRASRKVVEAAKRAIAAIMAQPGEFTTDVVGLDDLLTALGELDAADNAKSDEAVRQAWDVVPPGWDEVPRG